MLSNRVTATYQNRVAICMSRTVVVAGVGHGLGSSVAREFASQGANVALLARSADFLEATAEQINETKAGTALAIPTDITDANAVERAFGRIHDRFGTLDVLVNNVTSSQAGRGGILEMSEDDLAGAWAVRVAGQFRCAKAAAADMAATDGGTILFTTSQSAIIPSENLAFATARHAVRGMARSMSSDLGDRGVQTIHVVIDGWIENPDLRKQYPEHERWMDPDEVAATYRRLADNPQTVHASEIDLRHPGDEVSF